MKRRRIVLSVLAALVVLVALGAPLWLPFFRNDVVDEAFPALSAAERDSLRDMPAEQQEALLAMIADARAMAADTARAMMTPDKAMQDDMPDAAEPQALRSGSWIEIDAVHRASGSATLWLGDDTRVLRFEDFRVTNGPQLHVLLTKNVPTTIFAGVGEDSVDLGPLKGNVGNQNYDIPPEVDLQQYRSAVIYCVPFRVVFSSAELT